MQFNGNAGYADYASGSAKGFLDRPVRFLFAAGPRKAGQPRPAGFYILLILSLFLASCSTAAGGYWIPPRSSATPQPELSLLLGTEPVELAETPLPVPVLVTSTGTPAAAETLPPEPAPAQEEAVPVTEPPAVAETAVPAEPGAQASPPQPVDTSPYLYYVQAADTLQAVAVRFGVQPEEITSPDPIDPVSVLTPGQLLVIPRRLANTISSEHLLPDSELVYSPSAANFDVAVYVAQAGGRLSTYQEYLKTTGLTSGAQVVQRVALENSINPRLLLALLEFHSGWVHGQPGTQIQRDYPMGQVDLSYKSLYRQLVWAVNQLSVGYYSWREGRLTELKFSDGVTARLAPDLNAGSAALQYYFSKLYDSQGWLAALDPQQGFPAVYERMFGSALERASVVEPLYPPGLDQPPMTLPFRMGDIWAYTGGPHGAWEHDGSYAALDFAPPSMQAGCVESHVWVTAAASGLVVRSGSGVVVLDLDGDGYEQTGWVLVYLHVSTEERIPVGSWVDIDTPLGHPSCEGGMATGTHVHIARKYNGEWIAAAGPMPFVLSGWTAVGGEAAYKGKLERDGQVVEACTCSSAKSHIGRKPDDPQ